EVHRELIGGRARRWLTRRLDLGGSGGKELLGNAQLSPDRPRKSESSFRPFNRVYPHAPASPRFHPREPYARLPRNRRGESPFFLGQAGHSQEAPSRQSLRDPVGA